LAAMSALPPKADIVHGGGNVRFVPKADSCTAAKLALFDRPVAHRWKCTKDLGGLRINYELNLCSLWIGKLAGFS
jgi:hypothetical protein